MKKPSRKNYRKVIETKKRVLEVSTESAVKSVSCAGESYSLCRLHARCPYYNIMAKDVLA